MFYSSTKILFLLSIGLFSASLQIQAQRVGIGTNNPNTNAILEISDASRGVLLPRMDSNTRKNIPATRGLVVYDSSNQSYWYHNGLIWVNMPGAGSSNGDMLFWNSNRWQVLPKGSAGQYLTISPITSLPVWTGGGSALLTTNSASGITQTSAISGGNISSDGGSAVTARGVVWSTAPNPIVALPTKTNDGSGTGSFVSNITGLNAATTYYVRAYATNGSGTSYGAQISFNTNPASFTIGQSFGGGVVFYVDGTGQHGLIAAPADASTGISWNYNSLDTLCNANGLAIGTGSANTTAIIGVQGSTSYAASLCRLYYNGGGYNDWYLPSLYELNQLFLQRNIVGGFTTGSGYYWSSSEINNERAWVIDFFAAGPNQQNFQKAANYVHVRPIRSF